MGPALLVELNAPFPHCGNMHGHERECTKQQQATTTKCTKREDYCKQNCWETEDGGEVGAHGQIDLRPADTRLAGAKAVLSEVLARQGGRGGTDAGCILNLRCTQAVLRIPPHCGSSADPEGTTDRDTARGSCLTALCSNSPNKHVSVMQVGECIAP